MGDFTNVHVICHILSFVENQSGSLSRTLAPEKFAPGNVCCHDITSQIVRIYTLSVVDFVIG
jgi:hypothetical protein